LKWTARSPIGHAFCPPKRRIFPPILSPQTGPPFRPPANSPNIKRPPTVDCGMVEFLDRDKQSNSVLPSRFGQGIKPPRRPNFAQNMHPNKWCRRSLARPNWSAPEYHDVDHGVVVGWPRRFCVIAPIAFVGGMGRWCCRTWCAVVFAVVLRSVVVFFCFVSLPGRGAGGQ
jgi:hypothetical protein